MAGIGLQLVAKVSVAIATIADFLQPIVTSCVDVCLENKKGRFWGEAGVAYLPNGSNKVKAWRWWCGSCLWTVVVGW